MDGERMDIYHNPMLEQPSEMFVPRLKWPRFRSNLKPGLRLIKFYEVTKKKS